MSLFQTIENPCPTCGTAVKFELVHSVNADRRPVLRAQLMAGTFQQESCPACGEKFRTEPEFSYLHMGAKQFLSVWPATGVSEWADYEKRAQENFDRFYGSGASPAAAAIGRELTFRTAFGWEAAREKLVIAETGIDDRTLELAKILLMRSGEMPPLDADFELRLIEVDDEQNLVIGQFDSATEGLGPVFTVPRTLIDEIEAEPEAWQSLRDELSGGPFVDVARLMIEPAHSVTA